MKKLLSIFLAVGLVLSSFSFVAIAQTALPDFEVAWEEWDSYFDELDNTLISLTPGADESEVNFAWHSDLSIGKPAVRISTNPNMSDYTEFKGLFTFAETFKQRVNRVTITDLEENTYYYYSYEDGSGFSEPAPFRTLSSDSFKVIYVSDNQNNHHDGDEVAARLMSYNWQSNLSNALSANKDISFILSAGDQTQNGDNSEEWIHALAPKALRSVPFATTVGNHDNKGTTYRHYVNNPNTYYGNTPSLTGNNYWFRHGDVLFMIFNSTNPNLHDHFNFTKNAVMENNDAKWRVGMLHHDIYGTGHHAAENDNHLLKSMIAPIADMFEFDIVLTGHEHIYGRSFYMYENKIVDVEGYDNGNVCDPQGTIYFTASGASNNNRVPDEPYSYDWLAFSVIDKISLYSTIEFDSNSLTLETFFTDNNAKADEFNITKTDTTFSDISDVTFGEYFDNALEILTGDYYIIVNVVMTVLKTVYSLFGSLVLS